MENNAVFSNHSSGNIQPYLKSGSVAPAEGDNSGDGRYDVFSRVKGQKSEKKMEASKLSKVDPQEDQSTEKNSTPEANSHISLDAVTIASEMKTPESFPSTPPQESKAEPEEPSSSVNHSNLTGKACQTPEHQPYSQITHANALSLENFIETALQKEDHQAPRSHQIATICLQRYHIGVCKLCSRLLKERSSWNGHELAVVAVLFCGHAYHANCLDSITAESEKYDPPCPVCTYGESCARELFGKLDSKIKNKTSKNIATSDLAQSSKNQKKSKGPSDHSGGARALPDIQSLLVSLPHVSHGSVGSGSRTRRATIHHQKTYTARATTRCRWAWTGRHGGGARGPAVAAGSVARQGLVSAGWPEHFRSRPRPKPRPSGDRDLFTFTPSFIPTRATHTSLPPLSLLSPYLRSPPPLLAFSTSRELQP
ncbi:hypothetical protein PR202_gb26861 [Eleusine coracana subsp. coracana]|uniref:RING-type domain-containing protein n=1 Tax=Eleusine coracana subsp. coracana TaxID=191504 RepID=A0AAV5FT10_ELECO|nr:hypothetical protein PR202_gb26861 [Eleusine coracana subsp. coracana]